MNKLIFVVLFYMSLLFSMEQSLVLPVERKLLLQEYLEENGGNALHFAVSEQNDDRMIKLLTEGIHINARNNKGMTPLHIAIEMGNVRIAKILLGVLADKEAQDTAGMTALHYAAVNGFANLVEVLLDCEANIERRNAEGYTALQLACEQGHEEVVKQLLSAGTNVEVQTNKGETPLHIAAGKGHLNIVKLLLNKGAKKEARQRHGWTALHYASINGYEEVMTELLKGDLIKEALIADNGWTPVHIAAGAGHTKIVKLLVANREMIDSQDEIGCSALHYACASKHEEIVKELLAAAANKDLQSKNDQSLLDVVDEMKVLASLHSVKRHQTALHIGAENGQANIVKLLLDKGAFKEARDKDEWTPLHVACRYGHQEVVNELLKANANTEAQTIDSYTPWQNAIKKNLMAGLEKLFYALVARSLSGTREIHGGTALHIACLYGQEEIVKLLLNAGANVKAQTIDNLTALHLAAEWGYATIVKLLLAKGSQLEARNRYAETALHRSCQRGYEEVVKELLNAGADIEAQSNDSLTSLHNAVNNGRTKIVKLLIANGASIQAGQRNGSTPLHLAMSKGKKKIIYFLLAAGADTETKNRDGKKPFQIVTSLLKDDVLMFVKELNRIQKIHEFVTPSTANLDLERCRKCVLNKLPESLCTMVLSRFFSLCKKNCMFFLLNYDELNCLLAKIFIRNAYKRIKKELVQNKSFNVQRLARITDKLITDVLSNASAQIQAVQSGEPSNTVVDIQPPAVLQEASIVNNEAVNNQKNDSTASNQYIRFEETHSDSYYMALAVDGEGTQALITAAMLKKIEEVSGCRIYKMFDCITGSGFGSLCALGMAASRDTLSEGMRIDKIIKQVYRYTSNLFDMSNKTIQQRSNSLRELATRLFKETLLSDALTRVIIPCTDFKESQKSDYIIDSNKAQRSQQSDFYMRDVAYGATAYENYFMPQFFWNVPCSERKKLGSYRCFENNSLGLLQQAVINEKLHNEALKNNVYVISLSPTLDENMAHNFFLNTFDRLHYRRFQPLNDILVSPFESANELLYLYGEAGEKAVENNESFVRSLIINKDRQHPSAFLDY